MAIKINIGNSLLPVKKRIVELKNVTFRYSDLDTMWKPHPLDLSIFSGERIRLQGDNGCGKSTLLKLITGALLPAYGEISCIKALNILYLDQEYSCIDNELTVYGQLEITGTNRPEHELKMLLNRFLFTPSTWGRKCGDLSGGEKMKLALCSLIVRENTPDMIIADEPTNNLDIESFAILTDTIRNYRGSLLVISHDDRFIREIGVTRTIELPEKDA